MRVGHGEAYMQNIEPKETTTHTLEWFLVIVGAAVCLVVSVRLWQVMYAPVPGAVETATNALPGLYVLEMLILSGIGIIGTFRGWVRAMWAVAGAVVAFGVMSAWSIGFAFLPPAFLFTLAAILATRRKRQNLIANALVWVGAGITQVSMMLIVIRIVEPNAIFYGI
jgi:hypothetical protein